MKRYMKYAAALIIAACTLPSCSSDEFASGNNMTCGEGAVTLSAKIATSDGTVVDEPAHIRIYNASGELVRHYTEAGMPEALQLMAGEYKAAVTVGEEIAASFDHKYYIGEKTFTVTANTTTEVAVTCKRVNVKAEVNFDPTIAENFGSTAKVWVAMATVDNQSNLGTGALDELEYTESKDGYFILPEGVTSLVYKFEGTHVDAKYGVDGVVTKTGYIEGLEVGCNTRMGFKFSPDAPGFIQIFDVVVDNSTEDIIDDIIWTNISIEANVNLEAVQTFIPGTTENLVYTVKTATGVKTATLRAGGITYNISTESVEGVTFAKDGSSATVTVTGDFFKMIGGGEQNLRLRVVDASNGELAAETPYRVQGLLPIEESDYDLWYNTVTLKAMVLDGSSNVTMKLGNKVMNATSVGNDVYSATFAPEWTETANGDNPSYYALVEGTGVFADNSYDCSATISGVEFTDSFSTNGGDVILNGNMEGNLSCFGTSNDNTTMWGSGNNSLKKGLCNAATFTGMEGSQCAKMSASETLGILASGNLFTGTFSMSGTSGTVGFGQKYTYTARPSALKFKYHATVGAVDITTADNGIFIEKGQPDQSSFYVCIIDWSARHNVTSGTGKPSGMWDPSTVTEMPNCGKIIAYGQMYVDTTTPGSSMVEANIPLRYYDTECAAPTGNYTIIIACATSRYGDYMNGCSKNVLYVDDFQWVY